MPYLPEEFDLVAFDCSFALGVIAIDRNHDFFARIIDVLCENNLELTHGGSK